jgi:hypothetical protein
MNDPLLINLAFTRLQVMGACWPALRWLGSQCDLRLAWETCQNGHWTYWPVGYRETTFPRRHLRALEVNPAARPPGVIPELVRPRPKDGGIR